MPDAILVAQVDAWPVVASTSLATPFATAIETKDAADYAARRSVRLNGGTNPWAAVVSTLALAVFFLARRIG